MGKSFHHQDPSEHHPGCIKGMFNHFLHHHTVNFALKKLPHRRNGYRKWIAVDEDDGCSRPSYESGESQEKYDYKMDNSAVAVKVSEPGSVHKKSMKSRIRALISEEVSKRKGRHKRSSSCPDQTRINRNSPIHRRKPLDKSNVQVNKGIATQSSPKVHEEVATTRCTCDLCSAMSSMNSLRHDKGERPVKGHTFCQDNSIYAIGPSRVASLEESRLFLDALDLLNMRKELFLNVLRDPRSSLAQQLHEKRLSKSRVRLTKSMSLPCLRALEANDVNFKHQSHYITHRHSKSMREVESSWSYASAGESNDQSLSLAVCSDKATPVQSPRQPKPTGNLSPVSCHHLNMGQDQIVIKRFKNLRELIRHAIMDSGKERQHIIKDAVLHKIPNDKKSMGYTSQVDASEKPSKKYKKSNLEQKSFTKASSFNDSFEKYNRLLESDPSREAKGKESEKLKLKTTVAPSPITSIPKRLNRIYSSPDLGLYHGLQSEEPLDSTYWETSITSVWVDCTSNEGHVISGKQTYIESDSNTENQTQMDKISKCESQENFVDDVQGWDKITKCKSQENVVDTGDSLDKISKSDSPENIEDAGDSLDKISKSNSRENIEDAGDSLDRISGCDSIVNIEEVDGDLDRISKFESEETFADAGFDYTDNLKGRNSESDIDHIVDKPILGVAYDSSYQEDDSDPAIYNLPDGGLVVDHLLLDGADCLASQQHELSRDGGTAIYENEKGSSSTWFHNTSISQVQVDKNSRFEFDYVKGVLDLSGFNRDESLGKWHSPGQPVDPAVLTEIEGILLVQSESSEIEDSSWDRILLFDLVNEVLLDIYHKSSSYWPKPLYFRSCMHPMPTGYHVLEAVWADINCYLRWERTNDQVYIEDGDAVAQDLAKYDGWMNLQFDSECVGLELEELLFDDLLEELLSELQTLEIE